MKTSSRPKTRLGVRDLARKLVAPAGSPPTGNGRRQPKRCGWCGKESPTGTREKYCSDEHRQQARTEQLRRSKQRYATSERGRRKNRGHQVARRLRASGAILLALHGAPRSWGRTTDDLSRRLETVEALVVREPGSPAARVAVATLHEQITACGLKESGVLPLLARCLEIRLDVGVAEAQVGQFFGFSKWLERYHQDRGDKLRWARTLVVRANLKRNLRDYFGAYETFAQAYKILANMPHRTRAARLWQHRALVLGGRTDALNLLRPDRLGSIKRQEMKLAAELDEEFTWLETRRELVCFATEQRRFDEAERGIHEIEGVGVRFSGHLLELADQRAAIELAFAQGARHEVEKRLSRFSETATLYQSARHLELHGQWERKLFREPSLPRPPRVARDLVYVPMCYFYDDKGLLEYI